MDPYSLALKTYFAGEETEDLLLHNSYGAVEEMPIWYFFRSYDEMPDLEKIALSICEGRVLDIGAGTGVHSICLRQLGHEVLPIDTAAGAVEIMQSSDLKNASKTDFFELTGQQFDTLLCLMNGIGFIGKLSQLSDFLKKADELLSPEGQIILDSSDIKYVYENGLPQDHYYGEVSFQYEYRSNLGEVFPWVYIDPGTLTKEADRLGWFVYFLHTENDQYLARLIRK